MHRITLGLGLALLLAASVGCEQMKNPFDRAPLEPPYDAEKALVDARTIIQQSLISDDPWVRAHAMEAIGSAGGAVDPAPLIQGLLDPRPPVQYAAAMAVGDLRYAPAKPALEQLIENRKSDERSVCAAIYAMYRLNDDRYASQLAAMLSSERPTGRRAAAEAMGKMGHVSAIHPLREKIKDEESADAKLMMFIAMARLGDRKAAAILEGYATGMFVDERLILIPVLAEVDAPHAKDLLASMRYDETYVRIRVAGIQGLAMLGEARQGEYCYVLEAATKPRETIMDLRKAARDIESAGKAIPEPDKVTMDSLKQIAANALGEYGRKGAVGVLVDLMRDPCPDVRLAAARATLRLLANTGTGPAIPHSTPGLAPSPGGGVRTMGTSDAMD